MVNHGAMLEKTKKISCLIKNAFGIRRVGKDGFELNIFFSFLKIISDVFSDEICKKMSFIIDMNS